MLFVSVAMKCDLLSKKPRGLGLAEEKRILSTGRGIGVGQDGEADRSRFGFVPASLCADHPAGCASVDETEADSPKCDARGGVSDLSIKQATQCRGAVMPLVYDERFLCRGRRRGEP
jgi:hypothetical protein